jgi:bifunctional UDP-N-acetylglucosamine pyrophosphorylase / glucosamine-1-phosphate N-acetyltransferase
LTTSVSGRPLAAVVMAAGEGSRMKSTRPKPIHRLCGRPMVLHVLDALDSLHLERAVVVVGHGAERVRNSLLDEAPVGLALEFVTQHEQRGTGDAVSVALTAFSAEELDDEAEGDIIVMPGDQPLFRPETLAGLVHTHVSSDAGATVLTAILPDATGLGRVVRGKGDRVRQIVEHRDATPEQLDIHEINTSVYVFKRSLLAPALRRLSPENSQGEYYLTDVIEVLYDAGYNIVSHVVPDPAEADGVNDRVQLARAETELRSRTNIKLMRAGVSLVDPANTYVDASVIIGPDTTIYPGCVIQGNTVIGANCEIGPNTRLVDCVVGDRTTVEFSSARKATIGSDAEVGPFAALEPGTRVEDGQRTGAHKALKP